MTDQKVDHPDLSEDAVESTDGVDDLLDQVESLAQNIIHDVEVADMEPGVALGDSVEAQSPVADSDDANRSAATNSVGNVDTGTLSGGDDAFEFEEVGLDIPLPSPEEIEAAMVQLDELPPVLTLEESDDEVVDGVKPLTEDSQSLSSESEEINAILGTVDDEDDAETFDSIEGFESTLEVEDAVDGPTVLVDPDADQTEVSDETDAEGGEPADAGLNDLLSDPDAETDERQTEELDAPEAIVEAVVPEPETKPRKKQKPSSRKVRRLKTRGRAVAFAAFGVVKSPKRMIGRVLSIPKRGMAGVTAAFVWIDRPFAKISAERKKLIGLCAIATLIAGILIWVLPMVFTNNPFASLPKGIGTAS